MNQVSLFITSIHYFWNAHTYIKRPFVSGQGAAVEIWENKCFSCLLYDIIVKEQKKKKQAK